MNKPWLCLGLVVSLGVLLSGCNDTKASKKKSKMQSTQRVKRTKDKRSQKVNPQLAHKKPKQPLAKQKATAKNNLELGTYVPPREKEPQTIKPLRTLYVSTQGKDTNNGLTSATALASLTQAALMVQPGDLVLVAGGLYLDHVNFKKGGTAQHPIVIRAMKNQTPVVTSGLRDLKWKPLNRFTFTASFSYIPADVWDDRTVKRLAEVTSVADVENLPGSFTYDRKAQQLIVHPYDGLLPGKDVLVVVPQTTGTRGGAGVFAPSDYETPYRWGCKGLWLFAPYIHLEGFTVAYQTVGIRMQQEAHHSMVKKNRVYGCTVGLATHTGGSHSVMEDNEAYLNAGFGICIYGAQDITLRNNYVWGNQLRSSYPGMKHAGGGIPFGLALYGKIVNPTLIGNTIAQQDPHYPMLPNPPTWVSRHKSAYGHWRVFNNFYIGGGALLGVDPKGNLLGHKGEVIQNTVIGGELYSRDSVRMLYTESNMKGTQNKYLRNLYLKNNQEQGFADPTWQDYRLREDSVHKGRGAHPQPASLWYVSPQGRDQASGRTPQQAFKSLAKACAQLKAGDTLYVMPGTYEGGLRMQNAGGGALIHIRNYGLGKVVIKGSNKHSVGLRLHRMHGLVLDGLIFEGFLQQAIDIDQSSYISFKRCVFSHSQGGLRVVESKAVRCINTTFVGCAVALTQRSPLGPLLVRNSLFHNVHGALAGVGLVMGEQNGFSGRKARSVWRQWQARVEEPHASRLLKIDLDMDYRLPPGSEVAYAGLGHWPIGARFGAKVKPLPIAIEEFRVVARGLYSAEVRWRTPNCFPNAKVMWRSSSKDTKLKSVVQGKELRSAVQTCSLSKLKPGTAYTVTVSVESSDGRTGKRSLPFTTPKALRANRNLYVSATQGSDTNTGFSREHAFASLQGAVWASVPGDTILVAPGVYRERVVIKHNGSDQKIFTLKSEIPGAAVLDCGGMRPGAIFIGNARNVVVDGFTFSGLKYSGSVKAVEVAYSENVTVRNCVFKPARDSKVSCLQFFAYHSKDLTVQNNLFDAGFTPIWTSHCKGRIVVEQNTLVRAGINAIAIGCAVTSDVMVRRNVIQDVMPSAKSNVAVCIAPAQRMLCDENLYWHTDDSPQQQVFGVTDSYGPAWRVKQADKASTLAEAQTRFKVEAKGAFLDPKFVDAKHGNFRRKKGAPHADWGYQYPKEVPRKTP